MHPLTLRAICGLLVVLVTAGSCKQLSGRKVGRLKNLPDEQYNGPCLTGWKIRASQGVSPVDLNGIQMPKDLERDLLDFNNHFLKQAQRNSETEFFKDSNDAAAIKGLRIDHQAKQDGFDVLVSNSIEFAKGDNSVKNADSLTESIDITIYSSAAFVGRLKLESFVQLPDCKSSPRTLSILKTQDRGGGLTGVSELAFNFVTRAANNHPAMSVAQNLLQNRRVMDVTYGKSSDIPNNLAISFFSDFDMPEIVASFTNIPDKAMRDELLGGQTTSMRGFKVNWSQGGQEVFAGDFYNSRSSNYRVYAVPALDMITASVPQEVFKSLPLSMNSDNSVRPNFVGFTREDFKQQSLTYTISTQGELTFDNFGSYFNLSKISGPNPNVYQVSTHPPQIPFQILSTPAPISAQGASGDYLNETYFIDFSDPAVSQLKAKLLQQLPSNASYKQVVEALLKKVNEAISYDYDSVSLNAVEPMKASQAVRARKGVCQHFAAIFVALSRSIGIPARVVRGFSLGQDPEDEKPFAGGHAWVEILIGNNYWLPLEPQAEELSQLASVPVQYLPLDVMRSYETKVGGAADLKQNLAYSQIVRGMVLTKMSGHVPGFQGGNGGIQNSAVPPLPDNRPWDSSSGQWAPTNPFGPNSPMNQSFGGQRQSIAYSVGPSAFDTAIDIQNNQLMMFIYATRPVRSLYLLAADGSFRALTKSFAPQPGWSQIFGIPIQSYWCARTSVQIFVDSAYTGILPLTDKRNCR